MMPSTPAHSWGGVELKVSVRRGVRYSQRLTYLWDRRLPVSHQLRGQRDRFASIRGRGAYATSPVITNSASWARYR